MKVKFSPQNVEFEIKPGESVMHVAQDHGIYIKSVCKGVPSCAECRVRLVEGEHNVLPPGSEELSLIGTGHFIDRRRLSCQLKCFGDITVDMTEQIGKENGTIVGRKKRAAVKDDRVEQAIVRRSEETPESGGETEGEVAEGSPVGFSEGSPAPRPQRDERPRENRGPRNDRGPRPQGQQQNRNPNQGPQQGQPSRPMSRPEGAQQQPPRDQQSAGGEGQPPREGGPGKRRRRRRGKGGGGGQNQSGGGSGGGPTGGSGPQGSSF